MTQATNLEELAVRHIGLHEKLADCHPSLQRGQVWCRSCGHSQKVNSAECLRSGWPKCCGYTMTIDAPDEPRTRSTNGVYPLETCIDKWAEA